MHEKTKGRSFGVPSFVSTAKTKWSTFRWWHISVENHRVIVWPSLMAQRPFQGRTCSHWVWYKIVVHSESKRKGNLLLFGDFVVIETNPWFDSESGHHLFKETSLRAGFLLSEVPVDFWSYWLQMLPPASAIQHEHFPLATPAPPVTVSVSTGSQTVNKHYFHLVCLSGGFITVWQHPVVVRSVEGKHHPFPSDKGIIAFDLASPSTFLLALFLT